MTPELSVATIMPRQGVKQCQNTKLWSLLEDRWGDRLDRASRSRSHILFTLFVSRIKVTNSQCFGDVSQSKFRGISPGRFTICLVPVVGLGGSTYETNLVLRTSDGENPRSIARLNPHIPVDEIIEDEQYSPSTLIDPKKQKKKYCARYPDSREQTNHVTTNKVPNFPSQTRKSLFCFLSFPTPLPFQFFHRTKESPSNTRAKVVKVQTKSVRERYFGLQLIGFLLTAFAPLCLSTINGVVARVQPRMPYRQPVCAGIRVQEIFDDAAARWQEKREEGNWEIRRCRCDDCGVQWMHSVCLCGDQTSIPASSIASLVLSRQTRGPDGIPKPLQRVQRVRRVQRVQGFSFS